MRAGIVLRAAGGASNTEIAREMRVSLQTVGLWRRNFSERRMEGLETAPRSGRPRAISDDEVQRVLAKTLEAPPDGTTQWSVRRLAAATGISSSTVHRIWRDHKLKPHQVRSFKFSTDPQLVEKVIDVVGLYLDPPKGALVICVDEKTQIQALDRTQPTLPDQARQSRPDDARLQAQRHHQPLRGSGDRDRRGHRQLLRAAHPSGVPWVPQQAREGLSTPAATRRAGQLLNALNARGQGVACATPARAFPLHPNKRVLDEHGRDLVLDPDQATGPPRCLSRRPRTDLSDRALHRRLQPARPAVRLDQDRRARPQEGRPKTRHFRNAALGFAASNLAKSGHLAAELDEHLLIERLEPFDLAVPERGLGDSFAGCGTHLRTKLRIVDEARDRRREIICVLIRIRPGGPESRMCRRRSWRVHRGR